MIVMLRDENSWPLSAGRQVTARRALATHSEVADHRVLGLGHALI